ncbi:methyltransferase domain-containing protein [Streptacidiphilus cavernicola]|uniref:Methyltransferase domain-containing protein n=1 Tax=Streptacidiphilus cavernicola TaxID=3342716 RepID=A0ABV6W1K4_9ACTN
MSTYTHGFHAAVLRSHSWRTAANSAAYLLPELKLGLDLLDVGCGPGTITADLALAVAPGRVTAIDSSAEVLAQAEQAVTGAGVSGAVFEVADVHALPYPDDSFDVVHAHQVLQHVADPVQALREMRRVCRPGGRVAARDSDYAAFTWFPAVPALDDWNALYHQVARGNGGEPEAGRMLRSWARAAGFEQISSGSGTWCYASDEERAWWGGMWAERITDSAIARQAVERGHATEDGLRRIAEGWRAWAADPDGWFSVLHGEVLCRA